MTASVTVSRGIAVLPGPRVSFLDHLVPLCHLWGIPLLCTDAWVASCAETLYPAVSVVMANHDSFQEKLAPYHTFVTVEPCRLHGRAFQFGEFVYQGEGTTVAGFHGNPSKFRDTYWIERYADEDTVLVYGQHLIDYLQEKGVWPRLKKVVTIGNVRKPFYEKHRAFFDAAIQPYLIPNKGRKTVLWAPTWTYPEPPRHEEILDELPSDFQILVKLHPFMHRLHPERVEELKEKYGHSEQIRFIDEIPLIYPFIAQADVYVGDDSSVAYDFLSVDRPIFVMGNKTFPWATSVQSPRHLFEAMCKEDILSEMRQKAYRYVFSL